MDVVALGGRAANIEFIYIYPLGLRNNQPMRRNREKLEAAVNAAQDDGARAMACFRLGVFHDNNSREGEAIPLYRRAIRLGLEGENAARAHAWLASSLFKTGSSRGALRELKAAKKLTTDTGLSAFLERLGGRIERQRA